MRRAFLISWKRFSKGDKYERAADAALSVDGQISRDEAKTLIHLGSNVPSNNVIVEIGTYRGRSAVALALGSRLGAGVRVYAIDPHTEFRGVMGGRFGPQDMAALYRNLVKAQVGDTVAVVCLPSLVVARTWSKRTIGLLWIDGDHTYEAVRADAEA